MADKPITEIQPVTPPRVGDIVIATSPEILSPAHRQAPAIVTYVDELIINAHVFQNEAGAVVALRLPHKTVRGPVLTQAYWDWPERK
jgi:hypothetical protein